jgi:hypothetical protein
MLVISRKPGERVHIGEDIEVAILEITGSRVVIGIAAPREIGIRRVGPPGPEGVPKAAPAETAKAADPPQPGIKFEYRDVDAEQTPRREPVVKIKRSRLKTIRALGETISATG